MWIVVLARAISTIAGVALYVFAWLAVAYFTVSVYRRGYARSFVWLAAYGIISGLHLFLLPSFFPRRDLTALLSPRIFLQGSTHFIAFGLVVADLASWLPDSADVFPRRVLAVLAAIRQRCAVHGAVLVLLAVAWVLLDIYISTYYPVPKA